MSALRSTPLVNPRGSESVHLLGGKWQLERCIGRGGTAAVYLARHHNNGRRAAIKVLAPALANSAAARARFYHEARTANRIHHHGVVEVLDDGTTADGRPYLVMELLEGKTLDARRREAKNGQLPLEEATAILFEILETLAHAHARGVVHRDLKPANVFLTRHDGLKLLDFGAAGQMALPSHGSVTRIETSAGTMLHASPEQVSGTTVIHPTTDVWACGVLLHLLLSGEYPFPFIEKTSYLAACARGAKRLDGIPDAIAEVIARAIAFDPKARYEDASEMYAGLKDAVTSLMHVDYLSDTQPSMVRRRQRPARPGSFLRSNELAWLLVATLLTVALFAPFLR